MTPRPLLRDRRGAAAIDFALALPVLLMLIVGVMQLGMALQASSGVRELIGRAGRTAIIEFQATPQPSTAAFVTRIEQRAGNGGYGLRGDLVEAAVATSDDQVAGVQTVTITVSYPHSMQTPPMPAVTINLREQRRYFAPI